MIFKDLLGYIATFFTTLTLIPQIVKVLKTRSTRDISLEMLVLGILGAFCWALYGLITNSLPIIIANVLVLSNFLIIFYFKLKYK